MANKYVYSGATGANDGSSWTNAWTSIASAATVAAGDVVRVHKTHNQSGLTASFSFSNGTVTNPVRVICVDKDNSDALSTGAIIEWTTSSRGIFGNMISYGISWRNTGTLLVSPPTDGVQIHENGSLKAGGTTGIQSSATRGYLILRNVDVDLSAGSSAAIKVSFAACPRVEWTGGTYTCRSTQTDLFASSNAYGVIEVRGVTFSGTVTNLFSGGVDSIVYAKFVGCVPPTYTNVFGTNPIHGLGVVLFDRTISGTITIPPVSPTLLYTRQGTVNATVTRYRTGGADDGEQTNEYSWEMASDADALDFGCPLISLPVIHWIASGNQTITVYVASGVTLQDDEFWIDLVSPNEDVSATAKTKYSVSRCAPLATPANLTTDGTSTWNGSGVGTKQKVSITINPTVAGYVMVRFNLAKPSTTVYVDPKLDIN
jgi:hypothetical protein